MRTIRRLVLASMTIGIAQASPVFSLTPTDGTISGSPGQTVGWGFDLGSDPNLWTTIIGTLVIGETNPGMGIFTDLISPQGGPGDGALGAGAPDWTEAFDANTFMGFGSYAIDPAAPIGSFDSGTFLVQYEYFTGDPGSCTSCFESSGYLLESFTVNVTASAPEPSTGSLMVLGAALIALCSWVRRRFGSLP
jgi:hypothetical protein